MNVAPLVRTILPLHTWELQKAAGPVFNRAFWRAAALSFVPPLDALVNVITREGADLDSPALLAPSVRRRIRNEYKRSRRSQFRDNPLTLVTRRFFLKWLQEREAEGHTVDPSRVRKLRDVEAEINSDCVDSGAERDLATIEGPIGEQQLRDHDATTLAWEFASYGEGGIKPNLRSNSAIWTSFGLEPGELDTLSPEDGLTLFLSRVMDLFGLTGRSPDDAKLRQMMRWAIRTHLPPEKEPAASPEALSKAIEARLVYRGHRVGEETGDAQEIQVPDESSTRFIRELEGAEELLRIDRIADEILSSGERLVWSGLRAGEEGDSLTKWVVHKSKGQISAKSVPVLASRAKAKLRAAVKKLPQ